MASQTTLPPFNVKQGSNVLGPVQPGAGLANIEILLDITAFNTTTGETLNMLFESSEDAVSWTFMANPIVTSPAHSRGVIVNTLRMALNFGNVADGSGGSVPVLSTANTRVRVTLTNSLAFHSNGGTITVS